MSIVNYNAFCKTTQKTLLPWQIQTVNTPNLTFRGFYNQEVRPHVSEDGARELTETFISKEKCSSDPVDSDLFISACVPRFGPFVKFHVQEIGEEASLPFTGEYCAYMQE